MMFLRSGTVHDGLTRGCRADGGPLTYTEGEVADAYIQMGAATQNKGYFADARRFLNYTMWRASGMSRDHVLQEYCESRKSMCHSLRQFDVSSFKGIFVQAVADYDLATGTETYRPGFGPKPPRFSPTPSPTACTGRAARPRTAASSACTGRRQWPRRRRPSRSASPARRPPCRRSPRRSPARLAGLADVHAPATRTFASPRSSRPIGCSHAPGSTAFPRPSTTGLTNIRYSSIRPSLVRPAASRGAPDRRDPCPAAPSVWPPPRRARPGPGAHCPRPTRSVRREHDLG